MSKIKFHRAGRAFRHLYRGYALLYVFVEEVNQTLRSKVGNAEFALSGVEVSRFDEQEGKFGSCDPNNPRQRSERRSLLREHFFSEPNLVWNLWLSLPNRSLESRLALAVLRPSTWHVAGLSKTDGWQIRREESDQNWFLRALEPVEPAQLLRLEEIFSFNHIGDLDIDTLEEGPGFPSPLTPLHPMDKFTEAESKIKHRKESIEEEMLRHMTPYRD